MAILADQSAAYLAEMMVAKKAVKTDVIADRSAAYLAHKKASTFADLSDVSTVEALTDSSADLSAGMLAK